MEGKAHKLVGTLESRHCEHERKIVALVIRKLQSSSASKGQSRVGADQRHKRSGVLLEVLLRREQSDAGLWDVESHGFDGPNGAVEVLNFLFDRPLADDLDGRVQAVKLVDSTLLDRADEVSEIRSDRVRSAGIDYDRQFVGFLRNIDCLMK